MKVGERLGPYWHDIAHERRVRCLRVSGDCDPIHDDEKPARAFGLHGVMMAPGMLNVGLSARDRTATLPADRRVDKYGGRFRAKVRPGNRSAWPRG